MQLILKLMPQKRWSKYFRGAWKKSRWRKEPWGHISLGKAMDNKLQSPQLHKTEGKKIPRLFQLAISLPCAKIQDKRKQNRRKFSSISRGRIKSVMLVFLGIWAAKTADCQPLLQKTNKIKVKIKEDRMSKGITPWRRAAGNSSRDTGKFLWATNCLCKKAWDTLLQPRQNI